MNPPVTAQKRLQRQIIARDALHAATLISKISDDLREIGHTRQANKFNGLMDQILEEVNIGDNPIMYGD